MSRRSIDRSERSGGGGAHGERSGPHYEVAQICQNGHIINEFCLARPNRMVARCPRCGEPTLSKCPACRADIHGHWMEIGTIYGPLILPQYCHQCGAPYPWTDRKLQAMTEMVEEAEGLEDDERQALKESLAKVTKDTPAAAHAAKRAKELIGKITGPAKALIYQWTVDVASETAVKVIRGQ